MAPAQIIAVGNQKGGVSKTTTTVHLAAALGELGRKVLIIDLDSNTSSTSTLGVPNTFLGTFEVMLGVESPDDVIITNDEEEIHLPENVHLICGRRNLDEIDAEIQRRSKFADGRDALKAPLASVADRYDFILLDTPPNTSTPTMAAYKTARWFLLSAQPDPLACEGLNDAMHDIKAAKEYGNPRLELLGVVLSCVDGRRTRLGRQLIKYVENSFPENAGAFETQISRAIAIPQAQANGRTLFQEAPQHKVTGQYRRLAKEIEARLQLRMGGPHGQA